MHLSKVYKTKGDRTTALNDVSFQLDNHGFVVITGKSGSGKSTLLNILGGLDRFDTGEIVINGKSTLDFKPGQWDSYRNTYVGFVFQEFYVIDEFTVGKNIALALELQGVHKDEIHERVDEILKQVDLSALKDRKPNQTSGGQKQRIAIARALVKNPQIILADEPTGNLDSETGKTILATLKKLSETKLVIMVTHDDEFAKTYGDRIIEMKDGVIIRDSFYEGNKTGQETVYPKNDDCALMVRVPKGTQLSEETINRLNDILLHEDKVMTVTFSRQPGFVTSKEKVQSEIRYRSDYVSGSKEQLELVKVHLPFSAAFKLALSSLAKKKFRLIVITLLFVISLVLVGIAANFMFYDLPKVTAATYKKAGLSILPLQDNTLVYKNGAYWSGSMPVTKERIEAIVNTYPGMHDIRYDSVSLNMSDLLGTQWSYSDNDVFDSQTVNQLAVFDDERNGAPGYLWCASRK